MREGHRIRLHPTRPISAEGAKISVLLCSTRMPSNATDVLSTDLRTYRNDNSNMSMTNGRTFLSQRSQSDEKSGSAYYCGGARTLLNATDVSTSCCFHDPMCPRPAVSTTRRVHVLLFPRPDVSISCCFHDPMCPRPAISTTRCVNVLMFPRPDVSTSCCFRDSMCPRSVSASTTRCVHCLLCPRPDVSSARCVQDLLCPLPDVRKARCVHGPMCPRPVVSTHTVPETVYANIYALHRMCVFAGDGRQAWSMQEVPLADTADVKRARGRF